MTRSRPQAVMAAAVAVALAFAAAAIASSLYRGSGLVFLSFNASFLALVGLVFLRPRLYVYTFTVAFLVLGFWLKAVYHAIATPGFVEPVGGFADTPVEWDRGLVVAAVAALGLIGARFCHLAWAARLTGKATESAGGAPSWFLRWRQTIWLSTIVLIVAVNAANLLFAFYQIGVKPKLLLPLRGHVLLAWLVNIGFALWVAALVWWDFRRRRSFGRNLVAPIGEALLSSTSAFSRMNFLLHSVPYVLAVFERRDEILTSVRRRSLYVLLGAFVLLFAVSMVSVFSLRVYQYYGYAAGAGSEPFLGHVKRTITKQVPLLFVHRWVGLEGVLAVGSAPQRSPAMLAQAIRESPKLEGRSLFQKVAQTRYLSENPDRFVFLGNAGPAAVLWFSDSLWLVFFGMALVGLILIATEAATARLTGNPFLVAVAGAALANVVVQTTFFYLTLVFLLQLWVGIGAIAALQRLDFGTLGRGRNDVQR